MKRIELFKEITTRTQILKKLLFLSANASWFYTNNNDIKITMHYFRLIIFHVLSTHNNCNCLYYTIMYYSDFIIFSSTI